MKLIVFCSFLKSHTIDQLITETTELPDLFPYLVIEVVEHMVSFIDGFHAA